MSNLIRPLLLLLLLWPYWAGAEPGFYLAEKGGQTLWLLGSVHAGALDRYPLPAAVEQAWQQSRRLVLESDLGRIDQDELAQIRALTHLPAGQRLSRVLAPALYQRTLAAAAKLGIEAPSLEPLTPWFAALTLTQAAMHQQGIDPNAGVDLHFMQRAQASGLPITGLERVSDQFRALASVAPHQAAMLAATLDELPRLSESFTQILTSWQRGDEQALLALLREALGPADLQVWLEQALLVTRNRAWLTVLPTLESHSFVVVGALHLYGPDGLLAGLRQQGYRVVLLTKPGA